MAGKPFIIADSPRDYFDPRALPHNVVGVNRNRAVIK